MPSTRLTWLRDFIREKIRALTERVTRTITRAANVSGDPNATGEQAEAIIRDDEREKLQLQREASDETRRHINQFIREHGGEPVVTPPEEEALKGAESGEKILKRIEREKKRASWLKRKLSTVNWSAAGALAGALGVLGTLGIISYNSQPKVDSEPVQTRTVHLDMPKVPSIPDNNVTVKGFDQNLNAQSEAAVKVLQDDMRRQDEIKMSAERLQRMKDILAQPVAILPARAAIAALPPAIRAVAARPLTITVTQPNQEPQTYQQTIGAVVTSVPEPVRERIEQTIVEECHLCGNRTMTFSSFDGKSISFSGFH